MFEIDYTKDRGPATRGEKITYYFFLGVLLCLFGVEVLINYEPIKLTIVFFLVAWVPLLFLHELGHAIAARLVGWEVEKFVIGHGKILKKFRFQGSLVEFRVILASGYVLPRMTPRNWSRMKSAFVYFAGPGAELLIFGVLYLMIGVGQFSEANGSYLTIMMQGVALSAVTGAVINLIPQEIIVDTGRVPNDGLGIIYSLMGKRAA